MDTTGYLTRIKSALSEVHDLITALEDLIATSAVDTAPSYSLARTGGGVFVPSQTTPALTSTPSAAGPLLDAVDPAVVTDSGLPAPVVDATGTVVPAVHPDGRPVEVAETPEEEASEKPFTTPYHFGDFGS